MEKKARIGRSALLIIGIIYTALGGTFVILGVALAALLRDLSARGVRLHGEHSCPPETVWVLKNCGV